MIAWTDGRAGAPPVPIPIRGARVGPVRILEKEPAMSKLAQLRRGLAATAIGAVVALSGSTAEAGGGAAIGKVAGDLTEQFNKAVTPPIPPKHPAPRLDYTPPEPVPGGSTTWSTGRITGDSPPLERFRDMFNRLGRGGTPPGSLTDTFNGIGRGTN